MLSQGTAEISNMQKMLVSIVIVLVVLSIVLCAIVLGYVSTIVPFGEGETRMRRALGS